MGLFDGMPGTGNFSPQLLQMLQAGRPAGLGGGQNLAAWQQMMNIIRPAGMGGGQNLGAWQNVMNGPQSMPPQQGMPYSPLAGGMAGGFGGGMGAPTITNPDQSAGGYWTPQRMAAATPMGLQGPMGGSVGGGFGGAQNMMGRGPPGGKAGGYR
jgi:hypothetical protein